MTERDFYTALANLQWFLKNNYREPSFDPYSETFIYGDGGIHALNLTEEGLTEATPLENRPAWERPLHEALKEVGLVPTPVLKRSEMDLETLLRSLAGELFLRIAALELDVAELKGAQQ